MNICKDCQYYSESKETDTHPSYMVCNRPGVVDVCTGINKTMFCREEREGKGCAGYEPCGRSGKFYKKIKNNP